MRGASDLRNAAVSHFAARRLREEVIMCEHDKCRPAQPAQPFSVRIEDQEDGGVRVVLLGQGLRARTVGDATAQREEKVLGHLLERGPARSSFLERVMGCPERTALRTLRDLAKRGLILKWPDGMYRLTDKASVEPGVLYSEDEVKGEQSDVEGDGESG